MESAQYREPWSKGKLVGQKPPLKPKDIWAIRITLQNDGRVRDLAMFDLAIDSKLRGCDLVNLRVRDITHGNQILCWAMVVQRKTQRPVQFELTEPTRTAAAAWIEKAKLKPEHVCCQAVSPIGLDSTVYGTHTMRRTKATLSYKRTRNLRAVQLLLGHSKLENTVRYLGIEVDDALEVSEQTELGFTPCGRTTTAWDRFLARYAIRASGQVRTPKGRKCSRFERLLSCVLPPRAQRSPEIKLVIDSGSSKQTPANFCSGR